MTARSAADKPRLTELLSAAFMARLDALDMLSRKILRGKLQGQRRSKRRGQSVEFSDHRPYVAGDDLRFVDWNIYGRLDQLFLKLFMEEQDLTVHILMDTSASLSFGEPSKERFIRKLAAAIGYVGLVNNNRVTLSAFSDGVTGQLANMRGRNYLPRMAELLLTVEDAGPSNFEKACRQISARRFGTGIAVVLSDFLFKEGFDDGLRRLVSQRYDLHVIQVLSPQEIDPKLEGDLKLVDTEDGDTAEVTISPALLAYYKRNLSAWCNDLKRFCSRHGGTCSLASSAGSVETLVLTYLRRLGLFT